MAKRTLKPEQYVAIEWLAQPKYGGKSLGDIATLCSIDPKTLYNWRRDDAFQSELKREMVRRSQDRLPELIDSLADIAIRDGNAAMAKLALQINGMLTDKVEVETKVSEGTVDMDKVDAELARFAKGLGSGTDE